MPIIVFFQILLTALACAGLWRFWSWTDGRGKASLIISAGFLIRALAGQILFWISWLRLPIARPLQLGNGFWFFATDGPGILSYADELISKGIAATLSITAAYPSHAFIQVFTTCAALFGTVASVAVLLNCAAFLATCAIILRLGGRDPRTELPRLVALAAIAFGPGIILWSLQPLKDTVFLLLMTALIALCSRLQELWHGDDPSRSKKLFLCAAAMLIVVYAMSGIRWYMAAFFWGSCAVILLVSSLRARRRTWAFVSGAILFVLLSQAVRLGGEDDVPRSVRRLLDPRPSAAEQLGPRTVARYIAESRVGFENSPGATTIAAGKALAPVPPKKSPAPPRSVSAPPAVPVQPNVVLVQPRVVPIEPRVVIKPAPVVAVAATPPPLTTTRKLVAGVAAMFMPRVLAQAFGLIRIGGGRGFWLFAELDTIVFDAVLLFAVVFCVRALRTYARVTPLFILLVMLFLLTAVPMLYTVTNFGTLFRLREMVYLLGALIPLTVALKHPTPTD